MRKGDRVKYIGKEIALLAEKYKDRVYTVHKKQGSQILVSVPVEYGDGSVHDAICYMPVKDFEVVK